MILKTEDIFKITLAPLYISYSDLKFGDYSLLEHQNELMQSSERLILIDAPTSSGKTLGIISRILSSQKNAILVYPTNELIFDQAKQIKKYLESINFNVNLFIPSKMTDFQHDTNRKNFNLFVFNAPTLSELIDELSSEAKKFDITLRTKGELIKYLLTTKIGPKIILTNPDTIFLLSRAEYKYGPNLLKDLAKQHFRIIAFDEFHMYSGISLANLLISLRRIHGLFDQIIISTATPPDSKVLKYLAKFLDEENNEKIISPTLYTKISKSERKYRKIRYECELELKSIPSGRNYISDSIDIETVINSVNKLYEKHGDGHTDQVAVLIILNSVISAEQIRKKLDGMYGSDLVGAIHGLIPHDKRSIKPITVGTSAIEIGIDFNASSIIFDASNSSSFVQRLGRGARHNSCEAIAYIPNWDLKLIKNKIDARNQIEYQVFIKIVSESMPDIPHYEDFIINPKSPLKYLLYAYLWRSLGYYVKYGRISQEEREKEFINLIEKLYKDILNLSNDYRLLPRLIKKKIRYGALIPALERIGFRSSPCWIPAVFMDTVTTISINDLNKINFDIIERCDINKLIKNERTKRYARQLINHAETDFLVRIFDIEYNNNIVAEPIDCPINKPFIISPNSIGINPKSGDPRISNAVMSVIEGELGIITTVKDWRFSSIPAGRYYKLIIGADALIAWYLYSEGL